MKKNDSDDVARVAEGIGLSTEDLKKQIEENQTKSLEEVETLQALVEEQVIELYSSLELPEIDNKAIEEKILLALSDHWWVQIDTGDGWQDYDPILGKSISIEATETFAPDELPEELYHSVSIKVVAEKWEQDNVAESIALDYNFLPSQHIGKAFNLSFQPLKISYDDVFEKDDPQKAFLNKLAETKEWLPVLSFDNKSAYHKSIMIDGSLNESPNTDSGVEDLGQSTGELVGGGLTGSATQEKSESHLSALWIDYDLNIPGQENQIIRRELFDLIGVAERAEENFVLSMNAAAVLERNLTLAGETQIMTQVGWFSMPFAVKLILEDAVSSAQQGIELYEKQNEIIIEDFVDQKVLPADLFNFLLARHELTPYAEHIYIDQVNIVSNHAYGVLEDNDIQFMQAIDIVNNAVAVYPSVSEDIRYVRMTQGVLDTALENYVLGNDLSDVNSGNASSLLLASSQFEGEWQMIQDEDDATKDTVLNIHNQTHIQQSLDEGFSVYAPTQVPENTQIAWWRIDPITGNTLGIGLKGWGQGSKEYTLTASEVLAKYYSPLKQFQVALFCIGLTTVIALSYSLLLDKYFGEASGQIKALLIGAGAIPWNLIRQACIAIAVSF